MEPRDPIRHVVVLGHPSQDSFSHAIAETYCETVAACGQIAVLRDLYAMDFDPLLKAGERPDRAGFAPAADVNVELELLRAADSIALIYPIWFGMPPAIIKGYVDRVLGAGFSARDIRSGAAHPLLQGKHMMLLTASGTSRPWLDERGQWEALRQAFDIYLAATFALSGHEHWHFDSIVPEGPAMYIEECLETVRQKTRQLCARLFDHRNSDAKSKAVRPRLGARFAEGL